MHMHAHTLTIYKSLIGDTPRVSSHSSGVVTGYDHTVRTPLEQLLKRDTQSGRIRDKCCVDDHIIAVLQLYKPSVWERGSGRGWNRRLHGGVVNTRFEYYKKTCCDLKTSTLYFVSKCLANNVARNVKSSFGNRVNYM